MKRILMEEIMTVFQNPEKGFEIVPHFANFILKLEGKQIPELFLAAGLLCRFIEKGHVCLNLKLVANQPLSILCEGNYAGKIICPDFSQWIKALHQSRVIGQPGDFKPLILDDQGRLYLFRYWEYEKILRENLLERKEIVYQDIDLKLLQNGLKRLFPDDRADEGPNWQKIAAIVALHKNLCLISGGPGTGKTTTVVKVIILLLEQAKGRKLSIALTAPTGKADMRLKESILLLKKKLPYPAEIDPLIPEEVSTLHRLLGARRGSYEFHYNEKHPLPYDIVIVDEASMIDLPLMAKLFQATLPKTKLIFLGDRDQLASIDSGTVFGDICIGQGNHLSLKRSFHEIEGIVQEEGGKGWNKKSELADCIVFLKKNYRFDSSSGIGLISQAINQGAGERAVELLKERSKKFQDIFWKSHVGSNALPRTLAPIVVREYGPFLKAETPEKAFQFFNQFRILCAVRRGPFGLEGMNELIQKILTKEGLIQSQGRWYHGQPIMITENDYQREFYNGDIGIIFSSSQSNGDLKAHFLTSQGALRRIAPSRLPRHETAFVMTIHKSQGSEFDKVLLLLPEKDKEILTKELLYTGITRAKKYVEIWGKEEIVLSTVSRSIVRQTGLREALWGRSN